MSSLEWVNTKKYPLDKPQSSEFVDVIENVRRQLEKDGCAVLEQFVNPEALDTMKSEVQELSSKAFFTHSEATVYGTSPDNSYPDGHPRRKVLKRENGFVAGDFINSGTGLRTLYHSDELKNFLAKCLSSSAIYEFGDPLAQLTINVVKSEEKHAWHFDSNEFAVSLLTQKAEEGGEFQYVPQIRTPGNENYSNVQSVVSGEHSRVRTIDLKPGDLQIFFGRYSMHRVNSTWGGHDRHTAILAYSKNPNTVGKPDKTAKIFGRKLAEHSLGTAQSSSDDNLTD
jgi:hypothetical protein